MSAIESIVTNLLAEIDRTARKNIENVTGQKVVSSASRGNLIAA